jgi:hypothetical protein
MNGSHNDPRPQAPPGTKTTSSKDTNAHALSGKS